MSVVDDLQAAKSVLMDRGRCRGTLYNHPSGQVCLVGAIGAVTIDDFLATALRDEGAAFGLIEKDERAHEVIATLRHHVPPVKGEEFSFEEPVWSFSDNTDTTDDDVFDAIDNAIAEAEAITQVP